MPAPATDTQAPTAPSPTTGRRITAWLQRAAALALAWALVSEGALGGGWYAAAWIILLASIHAWIDGWRPWRPRLGALLRFAAYFLTQSIRGGVDVAWRALSPRMPIAPQMLPLVLRVPPGPARVLLTISVSLLPGTLAVAVDDNRLLLHVIDERLPVEQSVRELERHVMRVFGFAGPVQGGA